MCLFANECYHANQASSASLELHPSARLPTVHHLSRVYISSGLAKCPNLHNQLALMRNVVSAETKLDIFDKFRPVPRHGPVVSPVLCGVDLRQSGRCWVTFITNRAKRPPPSSSSSFSSFSSSSYRISAV